MGLIIIAFVIIYALRGLKKINAETFQELKARTLTWAWLTPLMIVPILAGAAWTMLSILVLSVLCYCEYAPATGLFRHYVISFAVILGILCLGFASIDHWYGFFVALPALGVVLLCIMATLVNQLKG